MNKEYMHVHPKFRSLVSSTRQKRLSHVLDEYWVDHRSAMAVQNWMSLLLNTPPRTRPPCLLVAGEPLSGKSTIIRRLLKENVPRLNTKNDIKEYPVVSIEITEDQKPREIYNEILSAMDIDVPHSQYTIESVFNPRRANYFELKKVRVLVIDEIHNILLTRPREQRVNLAFIRRLTNLHRFSVMAFGTEVAEHAIILDEQLNTRFFKLRLERWKTKADSQSDFRSFLAGYETLLPFREPSQLSRKEIVELLMEMSGGVVGQVVERIRMAATHAIIQDSRCIEVKHFLESNSPPDLSGLILDAVNSQE